MTDPNSRTSPQIYVPQLMQESQRKEQLSIAYVHAVASVAGYDLGTKSVDDDGWDIGIVSSGDHGSGKGPSILVQLKATASDILRPTEIVFPLKIHNYNKLIGRSVNPRILVVFHMPSDTTSWLSNDENQLIIKRCAYWKSLKNDPPTSNSDTVTVRIPRENTFTPVALHKMFDKIGRGEDL